MSPFAVHRLLSNWITSVAPAYSRMHRSVLIICLHSQSLLGCRWTLSASCMGACFFRDLASGGLRAIDGWAPVFLGRTLLPVHNNHGLIDTCLARWCSAMPPPVTPLCIPSRAAYPTRSCFRWAPTASLWLD